MTGTSETSGTTGMRPLWEAYAEAAEKSGLENGGSAERALFAIVTGKMMNTWIMRRSYAQDRFTLAGFYEWLFCGDGRRLMIAIVQASVVCVTNKSGPIDWEDGKRLRELEEDLAQNAFWTVGGCWLFSYDWRKTEKCIDKLARLAGCCTGDEWIKLMEMDSRPYSIALSKEDGDEIMKGMKGEAER